MTIDNMCNTNHWQGCLHADCVALQQVCYVKVLHQNNENTGMQSRTLDRQFMHEGMSIMLSEQCKCLRHTSTIAAMDAPNGRLADVSLAATANTMATAISAAKPTMEPVINSTRRPILSTMMTVMMVAISWTPLTMTAAMREPWLPDPKALTPAKIWGAKKETPLTPDHCLQISTSSISTK